MVGVFVLLAICLAAGAAPTAVLGLAPAFLVTLETLAEGEGTAESERPGWEEKVIPVVENRLLWST